MKKHLQIMLMLVMPAVAVSVFSSCSSGEKSFECPDCNVILISIDTLRADHLGIYGYGKKTSPFIDEFAKDCVVFRNAISASSKTLPSHASIFTSRIPDHLGVLNNRRYMLPEEAVTVAEMLSKRGYRTVSFNDGGYVHRKTGLDQGFDLYRSSRRKSDKKFRKNVLSAKKWISKWKKKKSRKGKFFLFLHTYEVHTPLQPGKKYLSMMESDYSGDVPDYLGPEERDMLNGQKKISREDLNHLISLYDASIRSMDDAMKELVIFLKKKELYDGTIIIFTSDHGEEYGERGSVALHDTLYDENLHVPLMFKLPGSGYSGKIIDHQVRSIDVLPTVLDILKIPQMEEFDGISLKQVVMGKKNPELAAISRISERSTLRTASWKLYEKKASKMLFNLQEDPMEKSDVSAKHPKVIRKLDMRKTTVIKSGKQLPLRLQSKKDLEVLHEQLKALGYM